MTQWNLKDLMQAMEHYGDDIEGWPAKESAKAKTLIEQSSEAQALLYSGIKVERALKHKRDVAAAPKYLADRIMTAIETQND